MVELFKQSSEQYRAVLRRQIDELTELQNAKKRDAAWQARADFAAALARDALKRVLPPDSSLFEAYSKATASMATSEAIRPHLMSVCMNWRSLDKPWKISTGDPQTIPLV